MRNEKTITVKQVEIKRLQKLLDQDEVNFTDGIEMDSTLFNESVRFDNGFSANVKVCSGQTNCWTEAVIFNNEGIEIGVTEPSFELLGEYSFSFEENEYIINVLEEINAMKNKKYCEIPLIRVVTEKNKEYVVKESDIHEGYWCPNAFHTFFNDLNAYLEWREYVENHENDDNFYEYTFDSYCDKHNIDYDGFPFEEYVDECKIKAILSFYQYVWNSNDESITPTSAMIKLEHYGTKRLGIVYGKYILVWSDLYKCNRQIPVEIIGNITGIEIQE